MAPPAKRVARYPFVPSDTERVVKNFWMDIREVIANVCEMGVALDRGGAISHSSPIVHEKMHGRALCADYRAVSGLRQINLGNDNSDPPPPPAVGISRLIDAVGGILRLGRQIPTIPALIDMRDIASAFRRILLRPELIHIFTTDITGPYLGEI